MTRDSIRGIWCKSCFS